MYTVTITNNADSPHTFADPNPVEGYVVRTVSPGETKSFEITGGQMDRMWPQIAKAVENHDILVDVDGLVYIPEHPELWADPMPTTVSEALDRISKALGSVIP